MRILRAPRALALAACLLLAVNCFTLYLLLCNEQRQAGSKVEVQYLEMQVRTQKLLISTLQRNISLLLYQEKQRAPLTNTNAIDANVIDPNTLHLPTIYMITPTYSRWTQKADLTRLCHTLMHVPKLHWILVEDSNEKTRLVSRFLAKCKVRSTHLNTRTAEERRLDDGEPRWRKNRGVEQRNLALDWLRSEAAAGRLPRTEQSVVYFGDDDNTYDIELFEEMRFTEKVSIWLVGISGGLKFEGPSCSDGRVTGWYSAWDATRPFQVDMAGFAISLKELLTHSDAHIDPYARRGYLESSILEQLVTLDQLEPKGDNCKKVLVWHTRTEVPKMKHEDKLIQRGKPSNPHIEV